jgi:hypothetical protein
MDPNAALEAFFYYLSGGELDDAASSHADLCGWLARGGFEPNWSNFEHDDGTPVTREWFEAWQPDEMDFAEFVEVEDDGAEG